MKEYVAATHKLSITLLAILFLTWQLAQVHASRVRMLNDAKELLTIEVFLRQGFPSLAPCDAPGAAGQECMASIRHSDQRREVDALADTVCLRIPNRVNFLVNGFAGPFELAFLPVDGQLSEVRVPNPSALCDMWPKLAPVTVRDESFGRLALYRVNMNCAHPMRCGSMTAFLAVGHDPDYGDWFTGLFSPLDSTIKPQTNRLIRELGVDARLDGAARIEAIQAKLFSQKIKIPFLDEVSVRTELAVWVLAFASFFVLVSMRNQLRLALTHPVPGHDVPWLLLDAETTPERAMAACWWLLMIATGAVTTFAVLLSATDSNQAALVSPPLAGSLATFATAIGLGAGNVWASLECAGYLLLLRRLRQQHRRKLDEQVQAG